jgi:hypothetical protein
MNKRTKGWHCPRCTQTSSRRWNMKTHIRRKHREIGEPIEAIDPSYSTSSRPKKSIQKTEFYDKQYRDQIGSTVFFPSSAQSNKDEQTSHGIGLFDYETLVFLREQNEWLSELVRRNELLKQLNSTQQRGMSYGSKFIPMAFPQVNFGTPQNNTASNIRPIGFCSYLCERCLWSIVLPISARDFLRMKYSVKVEHIKCSDNDISKINRQLEQKKIVDLPTKVKETREVLLGLLTERVSSWIGKGEVCLCAVEAPPKLFSEEFGRNSTNNSHSLTELIFPWTEGNYVDLGYVRKEHWAYRLIKREENKKMKISKNQLREFLNITNSTIKAFKAHMEEDDVATRYFHLFCLSTADLG